MADGTIWTCPMHPQIRRVRTRYCPICGMALEPLDPSLEEGPNPELINMTRRFWVSAILTVRWWCWSWPWRWQDGNRCPCVG